MSSMTITGDKRCKQTQERTGPHNNNLDSEGPEGPIETSRAGNIALTTTAMNTNGKRCTPAITLDRWEKKGHGQRTTDGNTKRKEREDTGGTGGVRKTFQDVEALEKMMSDLRSQLNRAAQVIVAKVNDLERLDKEEEKLQQPYNRVKQRNTPNGGNTLERGSLALWA